MTKKIIYKDSTVHFTEYNGHWSMNPHNCFCCNQPIKNGKAILVVNNDKYVPNILLHTDCFAQWESKPEALVSDIEEVWEQFQQLNKIFNKY